MITEETLSDHYREKYGDGSYMEVEIIGHNFVRFSGRLAQDTLYNYVALRVCGGRAETPFTSGVPFSVAAEIDLQKALEIHRDDGKRTCVTAMACQNYEPGDSSLSGFRFQKTDPIYLTPDIDLDQIQGCQFTLIPNS